MTTAHIPPEVLTRAGLPAAEAENWAASAPHPHGTFAAASDVVSVFLSRGEALVRRLPAPARCSADERAAREVIAGIMTGARERFLRAYAAALYDALTADRTRPLRLDALVSEAATLVPGLVPSSAEMDAERARALPDKEGIEFAHGLLISHILALPGPGRHLIGAMLQPTAAVFEHLGELRDTGTADLGPVRVVRRGRAGILELSNPRHLNAEDETTLAATECGIDLILLDPAIEVGVIRGGVTQHPSYPGMRVFGSGINLTHLYQGRIDYLFYLERDLGYVNKIYRGIVPATQDLGAWADSAGHEGAVEKLWVAAVECFAIGGACQLLHVVDHVIATQGSRLFLPARKEGIIPGASNLRLPRFVGDRAARQAILSGREWAAGDEDAASLCDEVVEPGAMDRAIETRAAALTDSGLVNATANRRTLRAGQEPLDLFREYMATYAREQAGCHLSPALVHNLEVHWHARERGI
ncbi:MAG TPA: enoyl-CoA hydratase-related protein [Streptosporangiaceae bacterium]|jgi:thioesterase DpgC|nr:enoyl-CoA hydratase-related protein [Streptosporangiaceae bacterium]